MVKVVENEKDNNPDGPAAAKRVRTNKIQQQTMFIVLITSVVVGVCLVLSIYFFKLINFNGKVITQKNIAVTGYQSAILDSGACPKSVDANKDDEISEKELQSCNPDSVNASDVPGTLRYNVMMTMAKNYNLETVARDETAICYDKENDNKKIDFQALYDQVEVGQVVYNIFINDEEKADQVRAQMLALLKMCSSLRVISEAMPTSENTEALMSSLNQIFLKSGWEPESMAPTQGVVDSPSQYLTSIPVALSIEAASKTTHAVLSNIENSIRPFNITAATITWVSDDEEGIDNINVNASAVSYYSPTTGISETQKTVKAKGK